MGPTKSFTFRRGPKGCHDKKGTGSVLGCHTFFRIPGWSEHDRVRHWCLQGHGYILDGSYRINGTGIFTYDNTHHFLNLGKYAMTMDPLWVVGFKISGFFWSSRLGTDWLIGFWDAIGDQADLHKLANFAPKNLCDHLRPAILFTKWDPFVIDPELVENVICTTYASPTWSVKLYIVWTCILPLWNL